MHRFYNRRYNSERRPLDGYFDFGSSNKIEYQKQAEEKLTRQLRDMVNDPKTGDLLQITLDYFERKGNVTRYVEKILDFCIIYKSMIDPVTLNFYAITSVKEVGLAIKYEMYSIIDLHTMDLNALLRRRCAEPPNETHVFNFYTFIGFLYFRFRSTNFDRHHRLVDANMDALLNLSCLQSLRSLKLLTKLVQLNFKALVTKYNQKNSKGLRHEGLNKIIRFCVKLRSLACNHESEIGRWFILAAIDFSTRGPILPFALDRLYKSRLQDLWIPFEWKIPVPMRAELSFKVIRYSLHRFDDLIDNFIEGTFCVYEELL